MSRSVAFTASLSLALALLWSSAAASQGVADTERHYDARIDYNAAFIASQRALPAQTNNAFAANLEEASVEADAATGAVSALTSQSGYLTEKASGTPMTLAMSFLRNNLTALGLEGPTCRAMRSPTSCTRRSPGPRTSICNSSIAAFPCTTRSCRST
jgi:extracellular elastinolytic metalloproteinase